MVCLGLKPRAPMEGTDEYTELLWHYNIVCLFLSDFSSLCLSVSMIICFLSL